MCSVGVSVRQARCAAQLVDQQQRRDLADARLHRRQADQLAVELRPAPRRCRTRRTRGAGRSRRRRVGIVGHDVLHRDRRRVGRSQRPSSARHCSARPRAGRSRRRASCSGRCGRRASCRSSRKPGSSAGRLTMKDSRTDSQPWRGVEGGDRGCSGRRTPCGTRSSSIITPAGVREVEHRHAPHLPVGVARDAGRRCTRCSPPSRCSRQYCDLRRDLLVGQVGQEGEGALGDAHVRSPHSGRGRRSGRSRACRSRRS